MDPQNFTWKEVLAMLERANASKIDIIKIERNKNQTFEMYVSNDDGKTFEMILRIRRINKTNFKRNLEAFRLIIGFHKQWKSF